MFSVIYQYGLSCILSSIILLFKYKFTLIMSYSYKNLFTNPLNFLKPILDSFSYQIAKSLNIIYIDIVYIYSFESIQVFVVTIRREKRKRNSNIDHHQLNLIKALFELKIKQAHILNFAFKTFLIVVMNNNIQVRIEILFQQLPILLLLLLYITKLPNPIKVKLLFTFETTTTKKKRTLEPGVKY